VPEEVADQVIRALGKTKIRGKKVQAKRDASPPSPYAFKPQRRS
jgi:hypothetical protein